MKKENEFEVKNVEEEIVKVDNKVPQLWYCVRDCFNSSEPDLLDAKRRQESMKLFHPGDELFCIKPPSRHWCDQAQWAVGGTLEKVEVLKELQSLGVKVTEALRLHDLRALREFASITRKSKRLKDNKKKSDSDMGIYSE